MGLTSEFLLALFPERTYILQLPLVDYSLGHELLLARLNSPFLGSEKKTDEELIPHLFTGLFICSVPWDEAIKQSNDPDLPRQMKEWRNRVKREDFHEAIARFLVYLRAGASAPPIQEVKRKNHRTQRSETPFYLRVLLCLMRDLGMTLEAALSCPMGLAHWLYFGFWESEGAVRIHRDNTEVIKEALKLRGLRRLKMDDFESHERN